MVLSVLSVIFVSSNELLLSGGVISWWIHSCVHAGGVNRSDDDHGLFLLFRYLSEFILRGVLVPMNAGKEGRRAVSLCEDR